VAASNEPNVLGHLIEPNANRYSLGKAHEAENWIDRREAHRVLVRVWDINASDELGRSISLMAAEAPSQDSSEIALFEIAVHPKRTDIDERNLAFTDLRIVANRPKTSD
jgi:hypothetical protein